MTLLHLVEVCDFCRFDHDCIASSILIWLLQVAAPLTPFLTRSHWGRLHLRLPRVRVLLLGILVALRALLVIRVVASDRASPGAALLE